MIAYRLFESCCNLFNDMQRNKLHNKINEESARELWEKVKNLCAGYHLRQAQG